VFRRRAAYPNQTWQSDHTELDILIVGADGKPDRPWLTTVMDDYSRAICGYMVFTGAPSAINTALVVAGRDAGSLWQSVNLNEKAAGPHEFIVLDGETHVSLYDGAGQDKALETVIPFFANNL
jgi:hypothetical protein